MSSTRLWDHNNAIRGVTAMQATIDKLEAENTKLKTPFGVLKATNMLSCNGWTPSSVQNPRDWAALEANYTADIPLADANDLINTENLQLLRNLRAVIEATGFPATRRDYKRGKAVTVPADWTHMLVLTHGTSRASLDAKFSEYKKLREKFVAVADAEKVQRDKEQEAANTLAAAKRRVALVDLCRDLQLDPVESSEDDVEEAILGKCKYLNLAVAGECVRNDWNDGCGVVENALSTFPTRTKIDKEIAAEWSSICENFEDGRSFRDCEWNYTKLRTLADPAALELWMRLEAIP